MSTAPDYAKPRFLEEVWEVVKAFFRSKTFLRPSYPHVWSPQHRVASSAAVFFQHLDTNFKGKISLTTGQKWPNFGAK